MSDNVCSVNFDPGGRLMGLAVVREAGRGAGGGGAGEMGPGGPGNDSLSPTHGGINDLHG